MQNDILQNIIQQNKDTTINLNTIPEKPRYKYECKLDEILNNYTPQKLNKITDPNKKRIETFIGQVLKNSTPYLIPKKTFQELANLTEPEGEYSPLNISMFKNVFLEVEKDTIPFLDTDQKYRNLSSILIFTDCDNQFKEKHPYPYQTLVRFNYACGSWENFTITREKVFDILKNKKEILKDDKELRLTLNLLYIINDKRAKQEKIELFSMETKKSNIKINQKRIEKENNKPLLPTHNTIKRYWINLPKIKKEYLGKINYVKNEIKKEDRASPIEHQVQGFTQTYHTKNGTIKKEIDSYIRCKGNTIPEIGFKIR